MGILGLTHDENGSALEKLPVTIKVAIGEGPEPGNQNDHPRRLDHFVFKRKTLRGQDVVWDPAPDIAEVHGEKPTELGVIFLNDQPTEVLRTQYAFWTARGLRCKPLGGRRSIRKVSRGRETTSTPRNRRKASQWSRVATDAPTLNEAIADRQETSISSWKNSRGWEPSAGFTRAAIDPFAIYQMA